MDNFIARLKSFSTKVGDSESSSSERLNGKTIDQPSTESVDTPPLNGKETDSRRQERKQRLGSSMGRRKRGTNNGAQPHDAPAARPLQKVGQALRSATHFYQRQPRPRQVLFWAALLATGSGVAIAYGCWSVERTLPSTKDISSFVRDGTLTIKAADGSVLQQQGPATREKLALDKIPDQVVKAFIAAEDRRFYQHHGIDYVSIVRAVASNLVARDVVEGGSTITQQLARVVYLNQERTMWRKVQEAFMAQKIERELSKEKILETYLNNVYLGSSAYGLADAAWVYFSKPVTQLTLSETATIAGLPPAPSEYSPLVNKRAAQERRDIVLARMQEQGFITEAEANTARSQPLTIKPSVPKKLYSDTPYFTSYIQQELRKYVSKEQLELGGLTIETTLNPRWQKRAEEVVKNAVNEIGPAEGFEQAALVSIDPQSGEIRAMVGGTDFNNSQFNRATQAQRQPGSSFKPILYTTALATGISPTDGYLDAPYTVDGYKPQNYSRKYSGWMSLREALTNSVNVISVKLIIDVGFEPVIKMAKEMGIKSKLVPAYSLALGSSEVNLLELTGSYGTLANQGKYVETHGIRRIMNRKGEVLFNADFSSRRAVDAGTAAIMAWLMQSVVNSGTGQAAQLPDRPVAGKTGTSEKARDLWFVGFVPQLVTGVWLGNDDNYPTWSASSTAAYVWNRFMTSAMQGMPVQDFPALPDFTTRKGSIKAKPITPGNAYSGPVTESEDSSSSQGGGRDDSGGSSGDGGGYSGNDSGSGYSNNGNSGYSEQQSYPEAPAEPPAPSREEAPPPAPEEAPAEPIPAEPEPAPPPQNSAPAEPAPPPPAGQPQ